MEAIIRHSPITCNGPKDSTYGNNPYLVAVYCTSCAKGSKAKGTVSHADPTHGVTGRFCLLDLAARHEHRRFSNSTQKKKGRPIIPFRIFKTYGPLVATN